MKDDFHPFKPPFKYNPDGIWIEDSEGNRILDVRGWGYLTGKGQQALGIPQDEASKIQDGIGEKVAHSMNASWIRL